MNPYALLAIADFLITTLLAIYVFYRNPKNRLNQLFSLYCLELGAWYIANFFVWTSPTAEIALQWQKFYYLFISIFPSTWLHLSLVFAKSKLTSRKFLCLIYLYPLIFGLLIFTTNLVHGSVSVASWGHQIVRETAIANLSYSIFIMMYVVSFYVLYKFYLKTASIKEKNQAKLFFIAMLIPFAGGIINEVALLQNRSIFMLPIALMPISILIIAYTILKHGLMTITSGMAADKIIETIPDYIIVIDDNLRVALANNSFLTMFGKNKDEIVNLTLSDISVKMGDVLRKTGDKDIKDYEIEILNKDKKSIPVSVNAAAIKNKQNIMGFAIVMRDISHTKGLIKNLEESNEELIKFKRLTVGRELKMIELKKEIERLKKLVGESSVTKN